VLLRDIAHSRTGDKGNLVTITLIAYRMEHFALLEREITAERVTRHFSEIVDRPVSRYLLPHLGAMNFVLHRPPAHTVTRSLALDAHGKCLGTALLAIEIPGGPDTEQARENR